MIRIISRKTWPSSTWEALPPGHSWVTLTRCPVPFVNVKLANAPDADSWRLYVGEPCPLDPRQAYEFQNIADPDIDLLTTPAPTDAAFAWLSRETRLLLSDHPIRGGRILHAYRVRNANAAGVTLASIVRWTLEGLTRATLLANSNGTVSSVQMRRHTPDNASPVSVYPYMDAGLTATTGAQFTWGDPLTGTVVHPEIPCGAYSLIVFPVTTTPAVDLTFHGWIGR